MDAPASATASLRAPPDRAVDDEGRPRYGAYAGEVPGVERAASIPGPVARALRRKRWVFIHVSSPRVAGGVAIAHVGYLGQVFAYAFDRGARASGEGAGGAAERPVEVGWDAPFGLGCRVRGGLGDVAAAGRFFAKRAEVRAEGSGVRVSLALGRLAGTIRVERLDRPLTVLSDFGGGVPGATIKTAGVPATGELAIDGRAIPLEGAFAAVDWTCAFFPYRTAWTWCSLSGLDRSGRPAGLNLCRGVHDAPGSAHTENALWLDGRPAALPRVEFELGTGPGASWRVRSAGGEVDLEVRPFTERVKDDNFGVVRSKLRHVFGTFHGGVRDLEGRACEFDGTVGLVEDHLAKW